MFLWASQCIAFPIFFWSDRTQSKVKTTKENALLGGGLVEKSLRPLTFFGGICELICKGLGGCAAKERYLRGNVCAKDGEKAVPRASVDATLCDSAPLKRENPELDAWTPRILGSDKARRTHCMALQQRLGKQIYYIQMLDLFKELRALSCDLEVGQKRWVVPIFGAFAGMSSNLLELQQITLAAHQQTIDFINACVWPNWLK